MGSDGSGEALADTHELAVSASDVASPKPDDVAAVDGRVEHDPDVGVVPPVRVRW